MRSRIDAMLVARVAAIGCGVVVAAYGAVRLLTDVPGESLLRLAVWLIAAVVLVVFSPVGSGTETSLFPNADFAWFPLSNPGIISIPLGFFCGWLGTVLSKEYNAAKYAEIEVRSLTGVGAEQATKH